MINMREICPLQDVSLGGHVLAYPDMKMSTMQHHFRVTADRWLMADIGHSDSQRAALSAATAFSRQAS